MSDLKIINVDQRTPEWYAARCGIVTASAMNALVTVGAPDALSVDCPSCNATPGEACLSKNAKTPTPIKTIHGERTEAASNLPPTYTPADNDTSRALILALAAERITEHVEETFVSHDMWRGIDAEPYARDLYSKHRSPAVECGFMRRDFGDYSIGYSPDGLVGDMGLIEIKAPRAKGHLTTIVTNDVPLFYMAQLQTALLVSGRKWIDYVSYSAGMPLWVKRIEPDLRWQTAILAAVEQAEKDIRAVVATYEQAVQGLPATERIDFNVVELKGIA